MATTPAVATGVPESPGNLKALQRLIGVFFSPKPTFQDIARHPGWVAPLAVLMVIYLALSVSLAQHVNWVEVSKDQIAKSKFASRQFEQLDDAQKERAYEQAAQRSKIVRYTRGIIGWPLLLLLSSVVYLGAFKLIGGGRLNFATAFAITAFAHLPVGLKELLSIPVVFLKDPASIDPENFLASNPAAIFGNELASWQVVPLAVLDVFGIWALILIAIGFSAADPKKLPFGKALGITIGVTLAFVCFFTGLAWAFS